MSKKILVVDDDPDITEQLSLLLKQEGYDVVAAAGREEAEQALLGGKPDLAILDLMMEHTDSGFMLCHEIKRLFPGTPVILLTSVKAATGLSFEAASAEQQSWVKADRVLDKPLRPEQLRNEVRRLLKGEC
jgi:CheY-like chemotaxis protein